MNTASLTYSWKTTTLGVLGLVSLLVSAAQAILDGDPATNVDFGAFVPALMTAIAVIFSKDADKTGTAPPPAP